MIIRDHRQITPHQIVVTFFFDYKVLLPYKEFNTSSELSNEYVWLASKMIPEKKKDIVWTQVDIIGVQNESNLPKFQILKSIHLLIVILRDWNSN